MRVLAAVGHALALAGSMTWEILWALILGFALSAVVQAVVRRSTIVSLMGDDRPRTLAVAAGLGAASSSCSYAAVALARSLFRKGANFTAAMAFEIGSTNLVVELGIILALLMGWQFTAAEFVGGPLMIVVLAVLFRLFVRSAARRRRPRAGRAGHRRLDGRPCRHGHVHQGEGSFWQRLFLPQGFTSVSHVFVMEWLAILRDLVLGLLIAGAIAAWVPESVLAGLLFDRPSRLVGAVGADRGTARGDRVLRLLDRQRAAGRGAVERRHQLRRRHRIHLRRPADPADPEHLPQVLRHRDDADAARHLLRRDGRRRLPRRIALRHNRSHPTAAQRHGHASGDLVELHHLAQHRLPRHRGDPDRPVHHLGRTPDGAHDGRLSRRDSGSPRSQPSMWPREAGNYPAAACRCAAAGRYRSAACCAATTGRESSPR